jgi:hypothetical protein
MGYNRLDAYESYHNRYPGQYVVSFLGLVARFQGLPP